MTDLPRCEATYQCVGKCEEPHRCEQTAIWRASLACVTPGCDGASHFALVCHGCLIHYPGPLTLTRLYPLASEATPS